MAASRGVVAVAIVGVTVAALWQLGGPAASRAQGCPPARPIGPWPAEGASRRAVEIDACDSWVHADFWIPGGVVKQGYDEVSVLFSPGTRQRVMGVAGHGWGYDVVCGEEHVRERMREHQDRRRQEGKRITTVQPGELPLVRHGVAQDLVWQPPADLPQLAETLSSLPVDHVRLDMRWCVAEPRPGWHDRERQDAVVRSLTTRGIDVIGLLHDPPTWANAANPYGGPCGSTIYPPDADHLDAWAAFVRRTVERYDGDGFEDAPGSPRVALWEVWNEPNVKAFWEPRPDPLAYAEVLRRGYAAAKVADPTAIVVMGGLSGNGLAPCDPWNPTCAFLAPLFAALGQGHSDAVNIHPYVEPAHGVTGPGGVQERVDRTLEFMRSTGDTRPLWLTEIGWPTHGRAGVGEAVQAARLVDVFCGLEGVDLVSWYSLRDTAAADDTFGVLTRELTPKAALRAWSQLPCKCGPAPAKIGRASCRERV